MYDNLLLPLDCIPGLESPVLVRQFGCVVKQGKLLRSAYSASTISFQAFSVDTLFSRSPYDHAWPGEDTDHITLNRKIEQSRALYACYIVHDISISLPKMSAPFFYARVFMTQKKLFIHALRFTHVLVIRRVVPVPLLGVVSCVVLYVNISILCF